MTVPRKLAPECPIERCIGVVSGRWKAMILWRLFVEPQTYSALEALIPAVSQRALSQALSELRQDGVIQKGAEFWSLTHLGEALRPALSSMYIWGVLHKEVIGESCEVRSDSSSSASLRELGVVSQEA